MKKIPPCVFYFSLLGLAASSVSGRKKGLAAFGSKEWSCVQGIQKFRPEKKIQIQTIDKLIKVERNEREKI